VVEEGLAWKVGNDEKVMIGIDRSMGCGEKIHLPKE